MLRLRSGAVLISAITVFGATLIFGHGEEIKLAGGTRGPVSLTAAQVEALGLKTVPADLRPIARLLPLNGIVAALPDAQAEVSLRISGNVQSVAVNVGDRVLKGQLLARVQSRVIGNPPPTVDVQAPIDGVIDERDVVVGQSLEPNTVLFRLSDHRRLQVVAKVYEEDLGKVKPGQKVFLSFLAYPGTLLSGVVRLVGPALDRETRTVDVWVLAQGRPELLKPNLFARADVVLGTNDAALTVPNSAILQANGETFVFVREGDRYDRVVVTIAGKDDEWSEVASDLVPGDLIVTQGAREIYTLWLAGGAVAAADKD